MALIAALTGRAERRSRAQSDRSRAVMVDADLAIREARASLAAQVRRVRSLDRWERLYAQRMADRVDIP